MASGTARFGRAWSIRTHFLVFGAILVLPLAALSGFLLLRVADSDRDQLDQRSLQVAAGVAAVLDRELQRRITVLQTLATSPSLLQADFGEFHAQALAALRGDGAGIFLIDRSLQQKLNTYVAYGTELPAYGAPDVARRVFETGTAQVSDFFMGRVTRRPAFDIVIPVFKEGKEGRAKYVLAMGLEPVALQRLVLGANLPRAWTVSVADRQGVILARSHEQDKFVGTALPSALSAQDPGTTSHALTLENEVVLRATARSQVSGWQVAVNFPETESEAALRRHLLLLGIWSATALALTAAAAAWFARIVARPLQAASHAAAELARSGEVTAFRSRLIEANNLVGALQDAGVELAGARRQQRLLLEELNHRIKNLLSVAIAMTQRTLSASELKEPRDQLTRRLHALARSQALIMAGPRDGAALERIVEAELGPFGGRIEANGPDVTLNARTAQAVTMILHELATNAAKYGALSGPRGQVLLTWNLVGDDEPRLMLRWQESDGPAVSAPDRKGFGTTLLEGALPEATANISYQPAGLTYCVEIPAAVALVSEEPEAG